MTIRDVGKWAAIFGATNLFLNFLGSLIMLSLALTGMISTQVPDIVVLHGVWSFVIFLAGFCVVLVKDICA